MPPQHISAGSGYSLVIDPEGKVWSFGSNGVGELGLGDDRDRSVASVIQNLPPIVSVATGEEVSIVLDQDGRISIFGFNILRYLGITSYHPELLVNPVTVFTLPTRIRAISVSLQNIYMLLDDRGQAFIFGTLPDSAEHFYITKVDGFGDMGPLSSIRDITAAGDGGLLLDEEGKVWKLKLQEENGESQAQIGMIMSSTPIKAISGRADHFLLLDKNGEVWSFGYNDYGQLGYISVDVQTYPASVPYLPPIKAISAGSGFSAVLDEDGHVWTCGTNDSGELGHDDLRQRARFEMIPDLPPMIAISAGVGHLLLEDEQGQVWSCGSNDAGELGRDINESSSLRPQVIPGLRAKFPPPTFGKFVRTTYPLMASREFPEYRVQRNFPNGDVLMEFDFPDQTYLARVQYDPSKDKISRPLLTEERTRFKELRRLIKEEKLTAVQLRPDIYQDEKGNQAIEFTDDENQVNLIRVYEEDGQIFPPL